MHASLNAIADELRRLKAGGVKNVPVSEEALAGLRDLVAARQPAPAPPPVPPPAPVVYSQLRQPSARAPSKSAAASGRKLPEPPVVSLPEGDKKTRWDALLNLVTSNPVCLEHARPGKKVVLGVGSLDARIFFCGEAPGAEEEVQGEPFVGPAGQLLTKMIQAMGLARGDVYIGNIMNWRPELPAAPGVEQIGNRPPTAEEMAYCMPFLRAQLEIVNPVLIVALGATAARGLLGADSFTTLGSIRGRWHEFGGKPLMVTYHPSYILRTPTNRAKRVVWEDLLLVMEKAALPISEKQRGYFLGR